jgi:putative endonuclease
MTRCAEPARPLNGPRRERVAAFRLGLSADSRAAMLLIAKGYHITARRWKTQFGEVDIVASRGRTLVFVEVNARASADEAAKAVNKRAKRRIVAAAEPWLAHCRDGAQRDIRFTWYWWRGDASPSISPMPSTRAVEYLNLLRYQST